LTEALERAVGLLRVPATRAILRRAAMLRDSSWTASALEYVRLYQSVRK
jgi:glycogen synthase